MGKGPKRNEVLALFRRQICGDCGSRVGLTGRSGHPVPGSAASSSEIRARATFVPARYVVHFPDARRLAGGGGAVFFDRLGPAPALPDLLAAADYAPAPRFVGPHGSGWAAYYGVDLPVRSW